jgi:hypothetical protein
MALVFGLSLWGGAAKADEPALSLGYAWPGMMLGQLRYATWPAGTKLLCGADKALPDNLGPTALQALAVPKPMAKAQVTRCGLFAEDADGKAWSPRPVQLGANPAELWAMALTEDNGGDKVAQIYLIQKKEMFADSLDLLSGRFGAPTDHANGAVRWTKGRAEAMLARDQAGGVFLLLVDDRLQELMQARIGHKR